MNNRPGNEHWLVKTFRLIALMAMAAGTAACAQSNTIAAPQPPRVTHIDSVSGFFDENGRKAVYYGNVRVDDPDMKLTCERLVVDLPQSGGRMNHIVAETNVVIDATDSKGQTMHATSDKAVYDYQVKDSVTNETVTLTGNAKVENVQGWMTGEPIVWNRANNSLTATDQHMVFRQSLNGALPGTNSPPATTNQLAAPK
jgi:lipopolysaccharide transport protein LptA